MWSIQLWLSLQHRQGLTCRVRPFDKVLQCIGADVMRDLPVPPSMTMGAAHTQAGGVLTIISAMIQLRITRAECIPQLRLLRRGKLLPLPALTQKASVHLVAVLCIEIRQSSPDTHKFNLWAPRIVNFCLTGCPWNRGSHQVSQLPVSQCNISRPFLGTY